jgi:hypothetical protein
MTSATPLSAGEELTLLRNHTRGISKCGLSELRDVLNTSPSPISLMELKITEWKTKQDFLKLVEQPGPELILFAAHWCGYCASFLGSAADYDTPFELDLIDVDDPDESLWDEYKIKLVPTLIISNAGKILFRKDARPGRGLQLSDLEEASSVLKKLRIPKSRLGQNPV